jgi:hypothetical protein
LSNWPILTGLFNNPVAVDPNAAVDWFAPLIAIIVFPFVFWVDQFCHWMDERYWVFIVWVPLVDVPPGANISTLGPEFEKLILKNAKVKD